MPRACSAVSPKPGAMPSAIFTRSSVIIAKKIVTDSSMSSKRSPAARWTIATRSRVASAVPLASTSGPTNPACRLKLTLTMSASRPAIDSTRLPPPPMRIGTWRCTGFGVPVCFSIE